MVLLVILAATTVSITFIIPLLIALFSGGGVAWYTARSTKNLANAGATEKAMGVVSVALDHLEDDNQSLRERIAVLESKVIESQVRISKLTDAIERMGGKVDVNGDVRIRNAQRNP